MPAQCRWGSGTTPLRRQPSWCFTWRSGVRRLPRWSGTVGELTVPDGAINIIPGRCALSLDIRAAADDIRDAAVRDIMAEIARIGERRGVAIESREVQRTAAVPCSTRLKSLLAGAVTRAGIAARELASGAGHDAMMFAGLTDIAMLFVRCGNGGVSHSPREIISAEDADIAARVLLDTVLHLAEAA